MSNDLTYDKEAYKQKKKQQLSFAYQTIDNACEELQKGNLSFFKEYLDVQSRFDKYSVRNALLIAKQNPNSKELKDYSSWKSLNVKFTNNVPNKIIIIEPGKAYFNDAGNKVTPYNAKELIDVSETNTKPKTKSYDKKLVLESILHDCPIKTMVFSNLIDDKICYWDEEENILCLTRNNSDFDLVIKSIAEEMAKAGLYDISSEIQSDKAKCIGYMICNKYNINCSTDEIKNIFKGEDNEYIKKELENMKYAFDEINSRMENYISKGIKEKNKEQER